MASTKRFITYQCNTCKRSKDFLADDLHSFINLCTITQNCLGKLVPIATKNLRSILPSAPADGVLDWMPRGTVIQDTVTPIAPFFLLDSNTSQVLTIAVKDGPILPNSFDLTFTVQNTNVQDYIEYSYSLPVNQNTIIGADLSGQSKVLKFSSTDNMSVYVNGVQSDQFTLSFSDSLGYAIVLSHTLPSISNVKVIIYPQISLSETSSVNFVKNSQLTFLKSTAWSSTDSVVINNVNYILYSSQVNNLPANKELNLYPGNSLINLDLSDLFFLISINPYTDIDRILTFAVPLNILSTQDLNCKYYVDASKKQIQVSYHALKELLKPMEFITSKIITTNVLPNDIIISLPVSKNVLGVI